MNGFNLKGYLEELRRERRKRYCIRAKIISFDGIKGSGKETQISRAKDALRSSFRILDFRETSLVKSLERIRYLDDVVSGRIVEDPRETAGLYTKDRAKAWNDYILKAAQDPGVILLDRSAYTTLASRLLAEKISSDQVDERFIESLFPDPIVPPDEAIFPSCQIDIAYVRVMKRRSDYKPVSGFLKTNKKGEPPSSPGNNSDPIGNYPRYAYRRVNGVDIDQSNALRWWLTATDNAYKGLVKAVPNGHLVLTGRRTRKVNPVIAEIITTAYKHLYK